jgi:hypothetical protein
MNGMNVETFFKNTAERAKAVAPVIAKRAAIAASAVTALALEASASTGTLKVTQGLQTFSGELSSVGYYICLGGIGVTAWDWYQHRSVGTVGWSGIGAATTTGLVMSAPTLLSMFGATAHLV